MTTLSVTPYKGTRDYYPEDKAVQNYIFDTWRTTVRSFGYQEYGTPLLEPLEVYAAKSGDELANEQTYAFTDRGDRTVAIRPEMTPSVSRLVAGRRQELAYPARLFSIANFMRYERPQRGREREFWQLNADMFGADTVTADAEIIQLADTLLKNFGADTTMYTIKINNRVLINYVMTEYLGLDVEKARATTKLLDRKNKLPADVFGAQALEILETPEKAQAFEALIAAQTIDDLPEQVRASEPMQAVHALFAALKTLGVTSAVFDITLMRGLDYYTGTVFELFDTDPENNRSLFGGGRYDGLVGMFGVEPISAVGFAPGFTTTELFLRSHTLLPDLTPSIDMYLIPLAGVESDVLNVAQELRVSGATIEVDTSGRKLDKQFKAADKKNARFVAVIGENELNEQALTIKNTHSGESVRMTFTELRGFF
jgi:histidyl-tRNA synthetase